MRELFLPIKKIPAKKILDGKLLEYGIKEVGEEDIFFKLADSDFQPGETRRCLLGPCSNMLWFCVDRQGFIDFRTYVPAGGWAYILAAICKSYSLQIWEIDPLSITEEKCYQFKTRVFPADEHDESYREVLTSIVNELEGIRPRTLQETEFHIAKLVAGSGIIGRPPYIDVRAYV